VNINAAVTATRGNLVVCCGQDINVNALVTTTNGSVLLSAGRDVNVLRTALNPLTGLTTTDGNIEMCAGRDVNLSNLFDGTALVTLTRGSIVAGQDLAGLGVPTGLTLRAGNGGTGPGIGGGTVAITAGTILTVTGPAGVAPINIFYNPIAYTTPTDYSGFFATGNGAPLTEFMLVYPDGATKTFDGTTTAAFTGLKGSPVGVTLAGAGTANFNTPAVGVGKTVSFTGFSLAQGAIVPGGAGVNFALPVTCCAPIVGRTTADIVAAVVVPPVVVPPGAVPPGAVAPGSSPLIQFAPGPLAPLEVAGLNLTVTDVGTPPLQLVFSTPAPVETNAVALVPPPATAPVVVPPE